MVYQILDSKDIKAVILYWKEKEKTHSLNEDLIKKLNDSERLKDSNTNDAGQSLLL